MKSLIIRMSIALLHLNFYALMIDKWDNGKLNSFFHNVTGRVCNRGTSESEEMQIQGFFFPFITIILIL